jgi:hypothetical protein
MRQKLTVAVAAAIIFTVALAAYGQTRMPMNTRWFRWRIHFGPSRRSATLGVLLWPFFSGGESNGFYSLALSVDNRP